MVVILCLSAQATGEVIPVPPVIVKLRAAPVLLRNTLYFPILDAPFDAAN
jgi:hypothetical protein